MSVRASSSQPIRVLIVEDDPDNVLALETVQLGAQNYLVKGQCDQRLLEEGQPVRWLSTTKVPLRNAEREIVGLVSIGRDITARKVAEEKLACYMVELKGKHTELEEDLNMAREVQLAFLPHQFPTFPRNAAPEDSTLQFRAEYLPATTLGGDFFHIISISDHEAGILICDVMGHGVRAALVTAVPRALVEELTPYAADPAAFLEAALQSA